MKRRFAIGICLLAITGSLSTGPSFAQTRRPSASPSATSQVAKAPVPIYFGNVAAVTGTSIEIAVAGGQTKSFTIPATARVEAPGITSIKGKPTVKNIVGNDTVAVVSNDDATASVIVIAAKGKLPESRHRVVLGIVSSREATASGTILSLKHPKKDEFAKVLVNTATGLTGKDLEKPTVDDIKASDKVIASGVANAQELITARKLHLIPGKARGLLEKVSSLAPQATKSASPSASGKATATPKATPR